MAASPAAAHADLESTSPADGAVLETAPTEVEFQFTGPVQVVAAPEVFGPDGSSVPCGAHHLESGESVMRLPLPELDVGTHVVTWRAIAGDGHPLRGTFVFHVGAPSAGGDELQAELEAASATSRTLGTLYGVLRAWMFASALLAIGVLGFALFVTRREPIESRRSVTSATARPAGIALLVLGAASALELLVLGPYRAGGAVADIVTNPLLAETLDSRAGVATLIRIALALGGLFVVHRVRRAPDAVTAFGLAALWCVGIVATFTVSGHARSGRWVAAATIADLVHFVAAGLWIGGLATLWYTTLRRDSGDDEVSNARVRSFSGLAAITMIAVVITGVVQGVRQLDPIEGLWNSGYGRTLLVKIALVAVVVLLGARSRVLIARGGHGVSTLARLRRQVGSETLVSVLVVGVTAALVVATPPRSSEAANTTTASDPVEVEVEAGGLTFRVVVDPARAGANEIVIDVLDASGDPIELFELNASATSSDGRIESFAIPFDFADGRYVAMNVAFPFRGEYTLAIRALTGPIDQIDTSATFSIS